MDNVGCGGSESSLADCYHHPWGIHNCDHDDDVAIECTVPTTAAVGKTDVETIKKTHARSVKLPKVVLFITVALLS